MEAGPSPVEIGADFLEKGNNNLEFGMRMARHLILKEIKNGCKNNVLLSPLSLHAVLNMVASGSTGRTLKQLLRFLESDSITKLNAQSSQFMELSTPGQEFLESEDVDDDPNSQPSLTMSNNPSFVNGYGGLSQSINEPHSFSFHGGFFPPVCYGSSSFFLAGGNANGNAGLPTGSNEQEPMISFVNGIWLDHRFNMKPSFKQLAEEVYKARAELVDFENQAERVRKEVNLWAKKATKGLIADLLPAGFFGSNTILALANALYFKGTWLHTFDFTRTRDEDFHLLDGKTIKVPFMISDCFQPQFYGQFQGFKLLKMPYKKGKDNKQYSMFIFLPDKVEGLEELVQKFNSNPRFLYKHWELQKVELSKMWIPKFKFSYDLIASGIMKELGLNLIFEDHGELTEIVDSSQLFVSDAIHKAYVEVNEQGTVAAAVTVVSFVCLSAVAIKYPPPVSFVADHPFMFMIKEEISGIVLFAGAVFNPL